MLELIDFDSGESILVNPQLVTSVQPIAGGCLAVQFDAGNTVTVKGSLYDYTEALLAYEAEERAAAERR